MENELLRMSRVFLGKYETGGLKHFHLYITYGDSVGMIGLSGAGKTVLYDYFIGNIILKSGYVNFCGMECPEGELFPFTDQVHCLGRESTLVPGLSVAENIFIINGKSRGWNVINRKNLNYRAKILLARYAPDLSPTTLVRDLSPAKRREVELLRAIEQEAKLVVIDDVLQGFGLTDRNRLARLLEVLREQNIAVLYECHERDAYIHNISRLEVLRKGEIVHTFFEGSYSDEVCERCLIGSDRVMEYEKRSFRTEGRCIEGITRENGSERKIFEAARGEIVGLYDMENQYNYEVLRAILGQEEMPGLSLYLGDRYYCPMEENDARMEDILCVPNNLHEVQLVDTMDFPDNLSLPILARNVIYQFFKSKKISRVLGREYGETLGIHPKNYRRKVGEYDLYTRERIFFQSLILRRPKILVCFEPYADADLIMRSIMFRYFQEMAKSGTTILIASQNMNGLRSICDSVFVLNSTGR